MDIYVEKKFSMEKLIPFIMLVIIGVIIFFVFRFLNNKEEIVINSTPIPTPQVNYDFLVSPEFNSLEIFPQYSIFVPGESVTPGRSNPFAPVSKSK